MLDLLCLMVCSYMQLHVGWFVLLDKTTHNTCPNWDNMKQRKWYCLTHPYRCDRAVEIHHQQELALRFFTRFYPQLSVTDAT